MQTNYSVYIHIIHTDKNYDKFYVGITKQSVKRRWQNGKGYVGNSYFYRTIEKYGWENIEHQIIATNITKEEALNFEVILIKKLQSNNRKYGYNLDEGGIRKGLSKESREKIKNKLYKIVYQYDTKGNLIQQFPSIKNASAITGIHRTNIIQCCQNQIKSAGNFIWSYDTNLQDIQKKVIAYHNRKRITRENDGIYQFSKKGDFIKHYKNLKEAEYKTGISSGFISSACLGNNKTAGGYLWFYHFPQEIENFIKTNIEQKNKRSKAVLQFDLDGNLLNRFASITEAEKQTHVCLSSIIQTCKGKNKTSGGFKWEYEKDVGKK